MQKYSAAYHLLSVSFNTTRVKIFKIEKKKWRDSKHKADIYETRQLCILISYFLIFFDLSCQQKKRQFVKQK